MALERTYIIPLRRNFIKRARYKRAKRAVNIVREFLSKHMKSEDVRLGNILNQMLWKRGMESPPGKVKVTVTKDDAGTVKAELFGHKYVEKVKVEKVEKSKLEQLKEKMMGKEEKDKVLTHEHAHDEHSHDHAAHEKVAEHEKKESAAMEKGRKSTVDKAKAGIKDKR